MTAESQSLIALKERLRVISQLVESRPEDVASELKELLNSDAAFSAAYSSPKSKADRFDAVARRLGISSDELRTLAALFTSVRA